MFPQGRPCAENILNIRTFLSVVSNLKSSLQSPEDRFLYQIVLMLSLMWPERISGPESFIAEVAGDDDSLNMVCFNVIFYGAAHPFLSTYFASMS